MKGRKRVAPKSTATDRLAALELQEREQREQLRSVYAGNRSPGSFKARKNDALAENTYYRYFHSADDDERTARRLLGLEETSAQQQGPSSTLPALGNPPRRTKWASPTSREPIVDITTLKPQSAKLYVKYEKLYDAMRAEDDEFFAFRRQFLEEEEERRLANGGASADVIASVRARRHARRQQSPPQR
uniref:Uncharacterized protein n=1 Tax=Neobodo designis TaxID=312471 RepID=A0A7S1MAC7_NEODS|mmetsp:Transcript_36874/g.113882  ORF Transcript_36874/g.113882 Transcript_36874/m.113882 type:complete len:188 (+) Transcript_36874:65-628(+)